MQSSKKLLMLLAFTFLSSSACYAADVKVIWHSPEDYSDVSGGISENHQAYHVDKVFTTFENYFAKLARTLPKNQKLFIKVMNVDLAGQAWGTTPQRTINSGTYPRLSFTYILKDEKGNVIKENKVSLKDMHFFDGTSQFNQRFLTFETRMIRKWFKKEFSGQLDA